MTKNDRRKDNFAQFWRDSQDEYRWRVIAPRGNLPDEIVDASHEGKSDQTEALADLARQWDGIKVEFIDASPPD